MIGENWTPSVQGNQELNVERGTDLHRADEEGLSSCTDDFAEVTPISIGSFTPTLTLQVVVPTNQWARISALASAEAECVGPFACDLDASTTTQLAISSPNGSLVS